MAVLTATVTDPINPSDTARIRDVAATASDDCGLIDSLSVVKTGATPTVTVNNDTGVADAAPAATVSATGTDRLTLTDAVTVGLVQKTATASDDAGLSDIGVLVAVAETLSDSAGLTDLLEIDSPSPPPDPDPVPAPTFVAPDHATPILEIGLTTDPTVNGGRYGYWSDPQRGIWGQSLWAPNLVWTDVTPWLQTVSWQRGATRVEGPILRYEAGTLTATLINIDGRFNPLNLSGPYVAGGKTLVRPMLPVRFRVAYGADADGTSKVYDQWRGYADGWDITYPSPTHSLVTLTATDAQKILSRNTRTPRTPVGAGELSGARVHRILNSVGWPAADRKIDPGETPLQATTLEGDAWSELLLVQDTELGEIYVDAAGKVVFKGRHAVLEESLSNTSQAIFGADRAGGELYFAGVTPEYDDSTIRNIVRITRVDGVEQEALDNASINDFLESVFERSDLLMQTDTEALGFANYLLSLAKDPELRFSQLGVDPRAYEPGLFPQVLARDFGDRITIRSRPPGQALVEQDVFIRGVSGAYGGTNRWSWSWQLQPASRFRGALWGSGKWGTATWVY